MKDNYCERENEILRAFAGGYVPDELKEHLRQCVSCHAATAISTGLQQLKSADMQKGHPLNYHWIMLQAQWRDEERLLKRFALANRLGVFTGIALFAGMTSFLLQKYTHARPVLSDSYVSILVPVVICVLLSEILFKNIHKTAKGKV